MKYPVITITREFGSGGRTIARQLAEKLGYDYYDYNLVQKIAKESGLAESYIEEHGEDANSESSLSFAWNNWGGSMSDQLYVVQRNTIMDLAEKGKCVIVGRCSDYILREREDTFHVFIHADPKFRQNRIVNVYGETDESIEKRVAKKDKRRIAYYKYYTDRKWGQANNYHICLNSGLLGIDECVRVISEFVSDNAK